MKTVIGLFESSDAAHRTVQELIDSGISRDDISLVANNSAGEFEVTDGDGSATATGATAGAVGGGLLGLLVGLGALAIPGIGPVVAAGPLAGALTGALAGGAVGGIVGALVDLGVSEDEAGYYAEGIRRGGTLVTVRTDDRYVQGAVDIMNRNGAVDIADRANQWRSEGWSGWDENAGAYSAHDTDSTADLAETRSDDARYTEAGAMGGAYERSDAFVDTPSYVGDDAMGTEYREGAEYRRDSDKTAIPVVEESIDIDKRAVERGGVRVQTEMVEEPVEEQVRLREEHVHVERRPVDRAVTDADLNALHDGTIEVTERAEEAVVNKEARVVEEVVISKDVDERVETVRDSVRHTEVHVDELSGNRSDWDSEWRADYDRNYASSGYTYDQYRPAYEYGSTLASDQRYSGRGWNEIETDARRDWESRYGDSPWENFKDAVRGGWERATGQRR